MDDVWSKARYELVYTVTGLGFPAELGEAMAKQLGSPKAIDRMTAYLNYERPTNVNMVVDEMLAICSEIDAWREKKAGIESNVLYMSEWENLGFKSGDESEHLVLPFTILPFVYNI